MTWSGARRVFRLLRVPLFLALVAALVAPFWNGNAYRPRIQNALSSALGRKVTVGEVHLSAFPYPALRVSNVIIADDPSIGAEPLVYVDDLRATPRLLSLWSHRLEFASLDLTDAHLNLARITNGDGSSRWNFEPLLRPMLFAEFPSIRMRESRINFKTNGRKAVFYLLNADFDVSPRAGGRGGWDFRFKGEPARTDRPAHGFGSLEARAGWRQSETETGRLDADLRLDRSEIEDIIALLLGRDAGLRGGVSGRVHLAGSWADLGLDGELRADDLHGSDQSSPSSGTWPFRVSGKAKATTQQFELHVEPPGTAPAFSADVRADRAIDQPRFEVTLRSNGLPAAPLPALLRNFGAVLPERMKLAGALDGDLRYADQQGWSGAASIRDATLELPGVEAIRFQRAALQLAAGIATIGPMDVLAGDEPVGSVSASYSLNDGGYRLAIVSQGGPLVPLLGKFPTAAVPMLSDLRSGNWDGTLTYAQRMGATGKWTGSGLLTSAVAALPALAQPLAIESAQVALDGPRLSIDRLHAHATNVTVNGEYRYDPAAARPHHFKLTLDQPDVSDIEAALMPSLRRERNLLDLALRLGRPPVPNWLTGFHAEGTVQADRLLAAGGSLEKFRARVQWDGAQATLSEVQVRLGEGTVTGRLGISLREVAPRYSGAARISRLPWRGGALNGDVRLESAGTGLQTLSNLKLEGRFEGRDLALEQIGSVEHVSGEGALSWSGLAPQFRFSKILLTADGEEWEGAGATQSNGEVSVRLSNGARQMNWEGPLLAARVIK